MSKNLLLFSRLIDFLLSLQCPFQKDENKMR